MKKSFLFFSLVWCMATAKSQDFGYEYYNILDYRSLGVNYSMQEFSPRNSNSLPDSFKISFKTHLPFVEYRELGLRVGVGYQQYVFSGKTRSSFSVYAESGNDIAVSGKAERNGFFLPVVVSANYVNAEAAGGTKSFEVGSLGIGTGVKYRYFSKTIGFQIYGTAALHYSSEGFSIEYGSSVSYSGEAQLIFPNIFLDGVLLGYRYQFQEWNMSNSSINYERFYHGPYIGIMF